MREPPAAGRADGGGRRVIGSDEEQLEDELETREPDWLSEQVELLTLEDGFDA